MFVLSKQLIYEKDLQQLLALILGHSASPAVTEEIARVGIKRLTEMNLRELLELKGVSENIAIKIHAIFEIYRKAMLPPSKVNRITSPAEAANTFQYLRNYKQGRFAVALLNNNMEIINLKDIYIGNLNVSIVYPKEIFREALKVDATSFICANLELGGDLNPSDEDFKVIKRLESAGNLLGIYMVDYVLIGNDGYLSLKQKGYI